METAIRWSPSSTTSEQRFLLTDVNGRTFRHCVVEKYDGVDFQYRILSTQRKVSPFRAFDWSPHDESLIAIGQWSGEATVLRLNDEGQPLSFPIKHQRLCNAVAFGHDGLLATGLERVRNDFCLNIWDIHRGAPASPSPTSPRSGSGRQTVEPLRKLASSEAITSIKFFPQPDLLVAGVKGTCLRLYDLRESMGNPSLQLQTTCVHNIAIDLLDENYFASAAPAKDSTIQIWDRRAGVAFTAGMLSSGLSQNSRQGPVISYRQAFDASNTPLQVSIWSLRYCKSRSSLLGALASTGGLKVFETKKDHSTVHGAQHARSEPHFDSSDLMPQTISTKRIHSVGSNLHDEQARSQERDHIVAFDFSNLGGPNGRPCAIILRADQSVGIHELDGPPPALSLSSLGSLASGKAPACIDDGMTTDDAVELGSVMQLIAVDEEGADSVPTKIRQKTARDASPTGHTLSSLEGKRQSSSREAHEHSLLSSRKLTMSEALEQSTITRRRCSDGYLFNCKKNAEIVAEDPWLSEMWTWIGRAKGIAADQGMIAESADLSYMGVFSIWNTDLGPTSGLRLLDRKPNETSLSSAIDSLVRSLQLPDFKARETNYPMHRQLCLHTCGLGLPYQQLEADVKELVQLGQNTKAAALAVIHDEPKLAFNALRHGKTSSAHRELSLALAGFAKGNNDNTWDETVREVAKELDDPYARAILALVSYGDWHDVLAEESLPLKYRIGVALIHLDDVELTSYINSTTADCIKEGDVEGIVLTGLTEKAVPLFQAYMLKFYDLQTPILALSFTAPRYFSDPLVDLWRESYRSLLNTYRLFIQRVQFDMQATKLSVRTHVRSAKPSLAPAPRQVTLRCNNCDQALDRNTDHIPTPTTGPQPQTNSSFGSTSNQHTTIFGDAKSGTVCPKCGRHMPRCVICMMWLGMPSPYPSSVAVASGTKSNIRTQAAKHTSMVPSDLVNGEQEKKLANDAMKDFITVCRQCWHMSHGAHSREWFERHSICAVPGCKCRCVDLDGARPSVSGPFPGQIMEDFHG